MSMEKITVDGRVTYEIIGQRFIFNKQEMGTLMHHRELRIEQEPYTKIADNLAVAIDNAVEPQTRRTVVHHDGCESVLQILRARGRNNTLMVHMRSSSFKKLDSDLSFLARLAVAHGCEQLIVNVGSLHYILGETNYA